MRRHLVLVMFALAACDPAAKPTSVDITSSLVDPQAAVAVRVLSGNAQTAIVGAALAQPIAVRAFSANGERVAGATVNFVVASGSGSITPASAVTNFEGIARATWTLGTVPGEMQAYASLNSSSERTTITATATGAPAVTVTADPVSVRIVKPLTAQLHVTAKDRFGNTVTTRPRWTSNDVHIATVTDGGLVTAVAVGSTSIVARVNDASVTIPVEVVAAPVVTAAIVRIDKDSVSLVKPARAELHATAFDAAGHTMTDARAIWTTSNAAVATVSDGGVVSSVGAGTAVITARVNDATATVRVTVRVNP